MNKVDPILILEDFKRSVEEAVWDLFKDEIRFTFKNKKLFWSGYTIHLDDHDELGRYIIITNRKKNFQSIFPKIESRKDILENVYTFMRIYFYFKMDKWLKDN